MNKTILWLVSIVLVLFIVVFLLRDKFTTFSFRGPPAQKEFPDGKAWMLVDPMPYWVGSSQDTVTVPDGFVHDGASIPGFLHSIFHKQGRYSRPAIVHDYLYWTQVCTRKQSDNLLLIAMIETKTSKAQRWSIYKAVRLGGRKAWSANSRERRAGKPRIIPADHRDLPNDDTWPEYREALFAAGVRDPAIAPVTPNFCQRGDSVNVPDDTFPADAPQREVQKTMEME